MTEQTNAAADLVNLTIDGKAISVKKGTTVYTAASQLGIEIPIFCYLDRMPPFGACRMCLVEVEKMAKLQTSCTLLATEGMVVKTQSKMAEKGREGILELLLINHPLDCPICDRGGECPLQDQTLKYGPGKSRFFEEKRHFKKPIPLGPVLMLDRERCITCARCTRFGDVIAGDHALEFIERGYKTEVGTPGGGPAESKFIGNTIMICPVGALTSDVYRFRARPWDNQPTVTTCTLCPVGCSMILDARDGEVMRTRSQENRGVNDIWLCDKGWFGYEFSSHPGRLKTPLIRRSGRLEPASWEEALSLVAAKIVEAKPGGKLAAFGGNPLTVEENYLFQKLMRECVGANHVDHRIGVPIFTLDEEGIPAGMEMSIGECEELSFAVLCGLDITEEFPVVWLRLKQAINCGASMFFLGHADPEIAKHLTVTFKHTPGDEIEVLKQHLPHIAERVGNGKKGAIFVGRQYLHHPQRRAILAELSEFQQRMSNVSLNIMDGDGNSIGARFAGMHPELGPFGQHLSHPGLNAAQVMEKAAGSGWDFLYVAGANPVTKYPSKLWKEARRKLGFLVVQDLFLTESAQQADVVLPALSFVEKQGTFLNIEGRVQSLRSGKNIPEGIYSDGVIFTKLAEQLGYVLDLDKDLFSNDSQRFGVMRSRAIPRATSSSSMSDKKALVATFAPVLFDNGVRMKHDPHLLQLAKEPRARLNSSEGRKRNIQDGDVVTVNANGNALVVKIKWDDRVADGTVVFPLGFDQLPVHELGLNLLNGLPIEIN